MRTHLWLWVSILWVACSAPAERNSNLTFTEVAAMLRQGKEALARFEGEAARTSFGRILVAKPPPPADSYCEAKYGALLADVQRVIAQVNPRLLVFLGEFGRRSTGLSNEARDLGAEWEAVWTEVEAIVREMATFAASVTETPGCAFSIGVEPEMDGLQYPLHLGDNERPVVRVILKGRFDEVEARVISALAKAALGVADGVLAHDFTLWLDPVKTAYQLGVPETCVREHFFQCIGRPEPGHAPRHLLDWAFVFEDNPRFLAAHPNRWSARFGNMSAELAGAVYPLRSLFAALQTRFAQLTRRADGNRVAQEFVLVYHDRDHDQDFSSQDTMGLNIADVVLKCDALVGVLYESTAECAESFQSYEALARGVAVVFLRALPSPSRAVVDELVMFLDRLHANFVAGADASRSYERIPFDSFRNVFSEVLPILAESPPNFVSFDVAAFFREASPVRALLPRWTTSGSRTGARFLADSDDYRSASGSTIVRLPDVYFDELSGGMVWGLLGRPVLFAYRPTEVTERPLFGCPSDPLCIPADCLNAANLTTVLAGIDAGELWPRSRWHWPVMYASLPDPSFHGVVWIEASAWSDFLGVDNGGDAYQGYVCVPEPGWQLATNLSLQRSLWLLADFIFDHSTIATYLLHALGSGK